MKRNQNVYIPHNQQINTELCAYFMISAISMYFFLPQDINMFSEIYTCGPFY